MGMGSTPHFLPPPGSVWFHRKTKQLYVVVGAARLEATTALHVTYRAPDAEGPPWTRPLTEWIENVDVDGVVAPRYVRRPDLEQSMTEGFRRLHIAVKAIVDVVMKDKV